MHEHYAKQISCWLAVGGIMVMMMVVIGGITRLTHSGLSIVTWQPVRGVLPPLNEQEWNRAFEAYKKIPEYKELHYHFTLQDYKKIFFWEYLHRMLGRSLGLVFIIPFLYFVFTKKIQTRRLYRRLLLIFALGGLQGYAGWYMVKSGLVENTRVDHIRLALHMSMALLVLSSIFWTILELVFPKGKFKSVINLKINNLLKIILSLLVVQIIYGGLTAGLKAGFIFPTFPKMGTKWLPEVAIRIFGEEGLMSIFNFPVLVQFIHRWLGFAILIIVWGIYFKIRKRTDSLYLKRSLLTALILVTFQYTFGVYIILLNVPIALAVTHQLTAFLLFLSLLAAIFFTKKSDLQQIA